MEGEAGFPRAQKGIPGGELQNEEDEEALSPGLDGVCGVGEAGLACECGAEACSRDMAQTSGGSSRNGLLCSPYEELVSFLPSFCYSPIL